MKNHFHTIVIGKGLVGSAAAKYLSLQNNNTAIIGTNEPGNDEVPIIYASHYDQARVQRIIGKDGVWTKLNLDSVNQYAAIEKQSGVQFHYPVGCLYVCPYGKDEYLLNAPLLSKQFNADYKYYNNCREIMDDFPCFSFPAASQGLLEQSPTGYINPRLLLKGQLEIFKQNGGRIFNDMVTGVNYANNIFNVTTSEGKTYSAEKILAATGSFLNYMNILPKPLQLHTKNEVILLVKVNDEYAKSLSQLPSLLYEINDEQTQGIYMIQPVQYEDGNYYLKIGSNTPHDFYFNSLQHIQDWFKNGDVSMYKKILLNAVQKILPDLTIDESIIKKCIISWTQHRRPYIGETLQKNLFVAGGCNGYSAMCSDAIGNVASYIITNGVMPEGYAANAFELAYA